MPLYAYEPEQTGGIGVDHVIEVFNTNFIQKLVFDIWKVGGKGTLPRSMNATRVAGYLHIIGRIAQVRTHLQKIFSPLTLIHVFNRIRSMLI